jgi:hypothetical protein
MRSLGAIHSTAVHHALRRNSGAEANAAQSTGDSRNSLNRRVAGSGYLDPVAHIDCIETPLGDVIRHFLGGRGMIVAIDRAGFKKASVTLDQLVTYQPKEKQPLRKCLHEVFDPLGLDFVVFPDGLLITAAAEKAEK